MNERRHPAPTLLLVKEQRAASDDELMTACARGDRGALGELYDRHCVGLYRFLSRLTGAAGADLDDLVSESFLQVYRSAWGFRGQAAVRTWITAVAANVSRHHVRSESRRRAFVGELRACLPVGEAGADGIHSVEQRDLLRKLVDRVAALPHDLRVVYILCDVEEIPGVEAARALGVPEGTIWRRLHQARRTLRAGLEGAR